MLDAFGSEAMHYAARKNDIEVLERLKAHGFNVIARDSDNATPMHYAVLKNAMDALDTRFFIT